MDHSNCNEHAESQQKDCSPLHRPYPGLTDGDALTPRIQSSVQRSYYLPLGHALRLVLRLQRDRELQGFDQGGRRGCEREEVLRHRWPFSVHRFVYVAIDESAKMYPLLFGEALIKYNHDSECAGLCVDRNLGLIEVIPGLQGDKTDNQAKDDAKRC